MSDSELDADGSAGGERVGGASHTYITQQPHPLPPHASHGHLTHAALIPFPPGGAPSPFPPAAYLRVLLYELLLHLPLNVPQLLLLAAHQGLQQLVLVNLYTQGSGSSR